MRIALANRLRTAKSKRLLTLASVLVLVITHALSPLAAPLPAQATRALLPAADSLLNRALASAATGDTATALDLLERANKIARKDPEVLYWRGLMLARSTFLRAGDVPRNWLAWRLLDRAAEIDPKNPRYLLEMGRIRLYTPLLRLEAERLFSKAMRVAEASGDPAQVADIAWELGKIKERRYMTARNRYLITSPGMMFDPATAIQQKHYTREFLEQHSRPIDDVGSVDRSEAEELFRRGLRHATTHEANAVALLGLLYDQRRFQEMREVVRPFLDARTGSARLRFAAGLAAYRTGELRDAELLFDEALRRLTAADRRDAIDLGRIIRRRDAIAYDALSAADRMQTDSAYWEAADPLLSTPENEGRLEFLARVASADLRFSDSDMRQTGWRTDRGLIVIRYGEPPVIATFAPSSTADAGDAVGRVITVWFYPTKDRQFVFTGPPAMNFSTFAGDMRGIAEEQREDAPFLLDNVPFAVGIDTLPIQIARFRGRSDGEGQLVVAAAVNTAGLYETVELDRSRLALSLRSGPPSRIALVSVDTVSVAIPSTRPVTRTWTQRVPIGPTRVRIEAQDIDVVGAAARAQNEVEIARPAIGAFEISDVLIAERFTAPATPLKGFTESGVVPRGSVTLGQRELFSLYWEGYGLRPDKDGVVHLDVKVQVTLLDIDRAGDQRLSRVLGVVADAVGLTREGEQQLGVRYQRDEALGDRDRVPQTTTIGLGTSPPGTYRLVLQVTDRTTGSVARTERLFYLSRK